MSEATYCFQNGRSTAHRFGTPTLCGRMRPIGETLSTVGRVSHKTRICPECDEIARDCHRYEKARAEAGMGARP